MTKIGFAAALLLLAAIPSMADAPLPAAPADLCPGNCPPAGNPVSDPIAALPQGHADDHGKVIHEPPQQNGATQAK